jgi:hypothetical protein
MCAEWQHEENCYRPTGTLRPKPSSLRACSGVIGAGLAGGAIGLFGCMATSLFNGRKKTRDLSGRVLGIAGDKI